MNSTRKLPYAHLALTFGALLIGLLSPMAFSAAPSSAATQNVVTLDICLQDDSNRNLLQFSSTTGDYTFTKCGGPTLSGKGTVRKRSGVITLEQNGPDRRVLAGIIGRKGEASVQMFSLHVTFTITDRNTANSTCVCP